MFQSTSVIADGRKAPSGSGNVSRTRFQSTSVIADGRKVGAGLVTRPCIKFQSTSVIADGRKFADNDRQAVGLEVSIHVRHC